jgi:ribose transport system substrate-binding protein
MIQQQFTMQLSNKNNEEKPMKQIGKIIRKSAVIVTGVVTASLSLSSALGQQDQVVLQGVKPLPNERYVMVTFLSGIEFWVPARKGMEHAAKQLGVQASYQGTEKYDATDQARVLDQVIASKPTGIIVTAQNPDALRPTINKAIDAGISLVMFDSDSPKSKRPVFLAGDNYRIGQKAADTMAHLLNNKKGAKVEVVTTIGQLNMTQRSSGFQDEAEKLGMKVVRTVEEGGSYDATYARTKEVLQAVPDLDGIFDCGSMGPGAAKAVQEAGKIGTIKIVGMDIDNALADLIEKGQVQATMVQGAWHMGYWGLWMSYAIAHGMVDAGIPEFKQAGIAPLPSIVDTGVYEVTKENLKYFRELSKP